MICFRCNNSIADSAHFCNTCGMEVPGEITQEARAKQRASDPLIDSVIAGKYRIDAKLGLARIAQGMEKLK